MLSIIQVRNDLLSKISIEDPSLATANAIQDVLLAINGTLQILQTAGQDFFTRETAFFAFTAGTAVYALPKSVQTIIGPARWNNLKPLRALGSRGELDQFDRIFLGVSDYATALGEPEAYWVENVRSGNSGDIDQINLYVAPLPLVAGNVYVDLINDAPNYTTADFSAGTAILPVAQGYQESVFLPIARKMMTLSSLFSRPDIVEQLQADYDRAMLTLAQVGGFPNAVVPAPKREVSG